MRRLLEFGRFLFGVTAVCLASSGVVEAQSMSGNSAPFTYNWTGSATENFFEHWVLDSVGVWEVQSVVTTAAAAGCAGGGACSTSLNYYLEPGGVAQWFMRSSPDGVAWSDFALMYQYNVPVIAGPTNLQVNGNNPPTYTWQKSVAGQGYYLWVMTNGVWYEQSWVPETNCAGTNCSYASTVTLPSSSSTFYVRELSPDNTLSLWSTGPSFTPPAPGIATPSGLSPSATTTSRAPTYSWDSVSGATGYSLWVWHPDGGWAIAKNVSSSEAGCSTHPATCTIASLPSEELPAGTVTWYVDATNGSETSSFASAVFTVDGPGRLLSVTAPTGTVNGPGTTINYSFNLPGTGTAATTIHLWVMSGTAWVAQRNELVSSVCSAGACTISDSSDLLPGSADFYVYFTDGSGNYSRWSPPFNFVWAP